MPSDGLWGGGSGYVPHPDADYERWIVEEVPAIAALADDRVDPDAPVFVGGLSMGGFGALRLGAKYPDRFRGISAHSAVTTVARLADVHRRSPRRPRELRPVGRNRPPLDGDECDPAAALAVRLRH